MHANKPQVILDDSALIKLDEAFRRHNKIRAVKIVQESAGVGLVEAKDYVDSLITDAENWTKPALAPELVIAMEEMMRSGDLVIIPPTYMREKPKVGRNEPCPCGSGKKYKKCCES